MEILLVIIVPFSLDTLCLIHSTWCTLQLSSMNVALNKSSFMRVLRGMFITVESVLETSPLPPTGEIEKKKIKLTVFQ